MKGTILDARTVAIVRELQTTKRQGANGEFESKDILFRIAVDRDYKTTRTENGRTIQEYPTDFWLAKCTGNVAQIFADHCTAVKEDGKLQSRHLLLSGNFENYTNTRKVKANPQVNIGGQMYQLDLEIDVPSNNTIFVVDELKFLDSNPANRNATPVNGNTVVSVQPVQAAQPVAQAMPVATAPQTVVQPIQAAQPAIMATAMNPPVVDETFSATGQTAPF